MHRSAEGARNKALFYIKLQLFVHKLATQPYSSIMSVAANGKPLCLLLVLMGVCCVGD